MGEQKLPPSQRKIKVLSQQGITAKSRVLSAVIQASISIIIIITISYVIMVCFKMLLQYTVSRFYDEIFGSLEFAFIEIGAITLVSSFITAVGGIVVDFLQTGFVISTKAFQINFDRLDLFSGLRRMSKAFLSLPYISFQLLVLLVASCLVLIPWIHSASNMLMHGDLKLQNSTVVNLGIFIFSVLSLASIDILLRYLRYRRDYGMTLDELRREHRDLEGDPFLKGYRNIERQRIHESELSSLVRRSSVILFRQTPLLSMEEQ